MYEDVKCFNDNNKDTFCKRIRKYIQENKVGVNVTLQSIYTKNMKKMFSIKLMKETTGIQDESDEADSPE